MRRLIALTLAATAVVASSLVVSSVPSPPRAEAQVEGRSTSWIPGIDVASHQHPNGAPIDWGAVARSGQRYAIVKATEGTTYRNPWFASDDLGARRAGLYVGAYHYARPKHPVDASARAEAAYFAANMGDPNAPGRLAPTLDLEEHGGLSPADLARWTQVFLVELEARTGKLPIIYTGSYFWNTHVRSTGFGRYPLWLANYTSASQPSSLPTGWPTWTIWQWTSTGRVPGIVGNVDLNRFGGGEAGFARLATGRLGQAPIGNLEVVRPTEPGRVRVAGWSIDLDDPRTPTDVHVYVGSRGTALTADLPRGDIASLHGASGGSGFDVTLDLPPGRHDVCAYAIEAFGGGGNRLLGCRAVGGDPFGDLEVVVGGPGGGQVGVRGWAVDPESAEPVPVHVYVYVGSQGTAIAADRPGGRAGSAWGDDHAFEATVTGPPGRQPVCVAAINAPGTPGGATWLGCRQVDVPSGDPLGRVEVARQSGPRRLRVAGWALDPDADAATAVHVYVNGRGVARLADVPRADVSAFFGHAGPSGFDLDLPADAGRNQVCVAAINAPGTAGGNRWLSCQDVWVSSGSPFGSVDLVANGSGGIRVAGWAADPDTDAPLDVHVYVGSAGVATVADRDRPDVAAATGWSATRGFDVTVPTGRGTHQVCVAAINAAGTPGAATWLTCRTVVR